MTSQSLDLASTPLPPSGTNYISVIKSNLNGVLIAHSFTVLLIPLVIAFLYFSPPRGRRQPIFILNLITIALAFLMGVLLDYVGLRQIYSAENVPLLGFSLAIGILGIVQSILVDIILLLRLVVVYPKSFVGQDRFLLLISLPIVLKIARVINLFILTKVLSDTIKDPSHGTGQMADIWLHAPYLKIEWVMQLIDNTYTSALFLLRLVLRKREKSANHTSKSGKDQRSFTERLKILFWIAMTNFVFPVLSSLSQIIATAYREVDYVTANVIVNDIVLANTMIAVIGVVFATLWAGSPHWREIYNVGRSDRDVSKQSYALSPLGSNGSQASTDVDELEEGSEKAV